MYLSNVFSFYSYVTDLFESNDIFNWCHCTYCFILRSQHGLILKLKLRLCSIIFIICARKHWLSVAQENKPKILNAQEKKTGTVESNQNKIDEKFSEVVETANIAIRNINESSEGVLMNKNDRRMRITKAVQIPITKIEWNWFLKRNTKNFRKQNV